MSDWRLGRLQDTEQGVVAWDRLGDGPPLVLIHGTPWSSFVWRQIAPPLSARWSVYFFDLPGFGASEKHEQQDVSLAAHGRVLVELLDAWGVADPIVVAHDIGGGIALRGALLHERSFAALALLDPVAISPWGSPFYQLVREHSKVFESLPPALHAALAEAYIRTALPVAPPGHVIEALLDPWLGSQGQAALYRQIAQGHERHTDEFRAHLARLDCPTLILWGEDDPWIPVQRGHELAALIPKAKLRTIPSAGHLVQEDAPGEVLRQLLVFLGVSGR